MWKNWHWRTGCWLSGIMVTDQSGFRTRNCLSVWVCVRVSCWSFWASLPLVSFLSSCLDPEKLFAGDLSTPTVDSQHGFRALQITQCSHQMHHALLKLCTLLHTHTNTIRKKSAYGFTSLFDLTKSWEIYTADSGSSIVLQLFYHLSLTHGHMLFDTRISFSVPPVCTPCTALKSAENAEITSYSWHSAVWKLHDFVRPWREVNN
jgi:hypothetical protein